MDLSGGRSSGAVLSENGKELVVEIDEFVAVFKQHVAVDTVCEVVMRKIGAADDHFVVEDVAFNVIYAYLSEGFDKHTKHFVPTRWQKLSNQILR